MKRTIAVFSLVAAFAAAGSINAFAVEKGMEKKAMDEMKEKPKVMGGEMKKEGQKIQIQLDPSHESMQDSEELEKARAEWLKTLERLKQEQKEKEEKESMKDSESEK